MGKSIVEKILAKAAGKNEVSPGDYVEVTHGGQRLVLCSDFGTGRAELWKSLGYPKLYDPRKIVLVAGHVGVSRCPPRTLNLTSEIIKYNNEWARKLGVPEENIYDYGRAGIEHQVSIDNAWALPGTVHLSVADGRAYTHGAFGCFAMPLSGASNYFLITGKTWVTVPESAKINITGTLKNGVMARDVIEYIISRVGASGLSSLAIEYAGSEIDNMSMDGRLTVVNGTHCMGAMVGIMNPDKTTIDYVQARTKASFEQLTSDPDAEYAKTLNFDVSSLEPQVVCHPNRYDARPMSRVEGMKITRGTIASCANSRMEDLRIAAKILKGKKINSNVRCTITPGSVTILRQALREGLIETFINADCVVTPPSCGMCTGTYTPLAAGDICISTTTINEPGRMGSLEAEIYLGSPATVAASCLEGKLVDPRKHLEED